MTTGVITNVMGCDEPALEAGEGAKAPLSASRPWGPNGNSSEDKANNGEIHTYYLSCIFHQGRDKQPIEMANGSCQGRG